MKIGVFCSANDHINKLYFEKAAELGRWIGENGHTLVFGGCNNGLMGCIAKATHEAGGQTIGIIPRIVEENNRVSDHVVVHIACNNLSDRKELLLTHSDVLVALPGGVGTLDEVFSVVASCSIGYHRKQVILYNIDGCWDSLTTLLDDLARRGMIRGSWTDLVKVAHSFGEVTEMLLRT